jgi:hypothetical protein
MRLHPVIGDLDLLFESSPLEVGATVNLVAYLAEPGSASHDAPAVLASWSASTPGGVHPGQDGP